MSWEYGIRLPNGTVAWDTYKGHSLSTAKGRSRLLLTLCKTAQDLDFEESVYLSHYGWARRQTCDGDYLPITDLSALGASRQVGDTSNQDNTAGGDLGAVQQRSLGCAAR